MSDPKPQDFVKYSVRCRVCTQEVPIEGPAASEFRGKTALYMFLEDQIRAHEAACKGPPKPLKGELTQPYITTGVVNIRRDIP